MSFISKFFKNIPETKATGAVVGFGVLLFICSMVSLGIQSSVRAFVGGESIWSKAQKDAVHALTAYATTGDLDDYNEYLRNTQVKRNTELARQELSKTSPDFSASDRFLISGGNHPRDVRMMGYLFHFGSGVRSIRKSIEIWGRGDQLFSELITLGDDLHTKRLARTLSAEELKDILPRIRFINLRLTDLEEEFTSTLSDAARGLETFVFWANSFWIAFIFSWLFILFRRLNRAKKVLHEETERYSLLVDGLNQAAIVAITDPDGKISFANDKFCEVSGYSRGELIGKTHALINSKFHSPKFFENMWNTISNKKIWKGEIRNKAKNGRLYWVDATIIPVLGSGGQIEKYMAIRSDITQTKEGELVMLQQAKMASLGEMAGGIAHEINNPLTIVQTKARLLLNKIQAGKVTPEETTLVLERIIANTERMAKVIQGLRSFSRDGEHDAMESVDVKTLINPVLDLCFERFKDAQIALKVSQLSEVDVSLNCRSVQIQQVILNLLNNAYDAVATLADRWIEVELKLVDEMLHIFVSDSGRGIWECLEFCVTG